MQAWAYIRDLIAIIEVTSQLIAIVSSHSYRRIVWSSLLRPEPENLQTVCQEVVLVACVHCAQGPRVRPRSKRKSWQQIARLPILIARSWDLMKADGPSNDAEWMVRHEDRLSVPIQSSIKVYDHLKKECPSGWLARGIEDNYSSSIMGCRPLWPWLSSMDRWSVWFAWSWISGTTSRSGER